ncbi:MAG: hypothetical protein ACRDNW_06330 [Trebonia sp.]
MRVAARTSGRTILVSGLTVMATTIPLIDLKILGVGTAVAIFIDATLVRGIPLPAALAILGGRAWGGRRLSRPELGHV